MKLGFSYKFLFYLLLIIVLAYIALKYFNVIEGNIGHHVVHSVNVSPGVIHQSIGGSGGWIGAVPTGTIDIFTNKK
jgi:hypothetical protein